MIAIYQIVLQKLAKNNVTIKIFPFNFTPRVFNIRSVFWDYKFEWVRNIHDWTIFPIDKWTINLQKKIFTIKVDWKCRLPNVFMHDLFIQRLWKCIGALQGDLKFHTKFHLHMCGKNIWHLKRGWRIIMWQTNVPLWSMVKFVSICIVSNNICELQKDIFDKILII
jgi:hypothetical protein